MRAPSTGAAHQALNEDLGAARNDTRNYSGPEAADRSIRGAKRPIEGGGGWLRKIDNFLPSQLKCDTVFQKAIARASHTGRATGTSALGAGNDSCDRFWRPTP